jgi:hypothetical protein
MVLLKTIKAQAERYPLAWAFVGERVTRVTV